MNKNNNVENSKEKDEEFKKEYPMHYVAKRVKEICIDPIVDFPKKLHDDNIRTIKNSVINRYIGKEKKRLKKEFNQTEKDSNYSLFHLEIAEELEFYEKLENNIPTDDFVVVCKKIKNEVNNLSREYQVKDNTNLSKIYIKENKDEIELLRKQTVSKLKEILQRIEQFDD